MTGPNTPREGKGAKRISAAKYFYLYCKSLGIGFVNLLDGMSITLKYFFSKPVTQEYPHEMKKLPERTRGTLILYSDPETMKLNCTVCLVCEVVCPNNSIHIDFVRDSENNKKYVKKYYWDADKCIYCGLCVEGCGFDSLGWIPEFEWSTTNRTKLVWDEKDMTQAWLNHVGRGDINAREEIDNKWY